MPISTSRRCLSYFTNDHAIMHLFPTFRRLRNGIHRPLYLPVPRVTHRFLLRSLSVSMNEGTGHDSLRKAHPWSSPGRRLKWFVRAGLKGETERGQNPSRIMLLRELENRLWLVVLGESGILKLWWLLRSHDQNANCYSEVRRTGPSSANMCPGTWMPPCALQQQQQQRAAGRRVVAASARAVDIAPSSPCIRQ